MFFHPRTKASVSHIPAQRIDMAYRLKYGLAAAVSSFAFLLVAVLILLSGTVRMANARPNYVPIVTDAYHPKAGGKIATNAQSCDLCHTAAGPPILNLYGTDVKQALDAAHTKTLTPAMLHSLDTKDSDGDGFNNGFEFAEDTLPGDAASKPAGLPPVKNVPSVKTNTSSGDASSNPYNLKDLLFPRHGQHPIIIHFPIALFIISLFFDFLGLMRRENTLVSTGYLNLTVAAITAPLALVTGFIAWQFAYGGISLAALSGNPTLLQHLILSFVTTILIWILWKMRFNKRQEGYQAITTPYIIVSLIALVTISLAGHLGGYLSGVN